MPPKKKQGIHGFSKSSSGGAKVVKIGAGPSQVKPSAGSKRKVGQTLSGTVVYESDNKAKKRAKTSDEDETAYKPSDDDDFADEDYSWAADIPTDEENLSEPDSDAEIFVLTKVDGGKYTIKKVPKESKESKESKEPKESKDGDKHAAEGQNESLVDGWDWLFQHTWKAMGELGARRSGRVTLEYLI